MSKEKPDMINSPPHYTTNGMECIDVSEHMPFCVGNAFKYVWRYKKKNGVEDLKKALWYLRREISRDQKTEPTWIIGTSDGFGDDHRGLTLLSIYFGNFSAAIVRIEKMITKIEHET